MDSAVVLNVLVGYGEGFSSGEVVDVILGGVWEAGGGVDTLMEKLSGGGGWQLARIKVNRKRQSVRCV